MVKILLSELVTDIDRVKKKEKKKSFSADDKLLVTQPYNEIKNWNIRKHSRKQNY